ncbi:ABC transporter substrate-binding protein [Effusibacillus lacus]|uniref:Polyamine ABC transporter substrate-binding protein n=1 Tax=Effusibacillus lacus TaxID=1348429 RepID=A0A292YJ95_9BACL|nr:ABC transporter substrate-binding protein [Effusibacillus lacus]TCS75516.1 putative spermidine/putrescine transport system substrate-binding protein [Effusibacillus lacus]GAX88981.1 polyamine ABC transporter substrate-binding protein [Effusibacillus lacus]
MLKKLFGFGLAASLVMMSVGCGSTDTKSNASGNSNSTGNGGDKVLNIMDWGGANTEAHKKGIYEKFEKEFGVKINLVTPTDYGKLKAMVQSGNVDIDVADVDSDFVIRGANEGLLEKLDYDIIKHKNDVMPEFVHDYGIGAELFSTVIAYNTNSFPTGKHPKTWTEFWDVQKFPGKRSLWKYPTGLLEAALLADGVEPNKLYPLDVDRAFKSLDKIKKDVSVWWTAGAQPPQLLANGEVSLAMAWSGRISAAQSQGAPEAVEFNQGLLMGDSWVVPKGTKHKELAMKFINFAVAPENQAAYANYIDYSPVNKKALDLLSKDRIAKIGQSPENAKNQVVVNLEWWVKNFDQVNERFEKWLLNK